MSMKKYQRIKKSPKISGFIDEDKEWLRLTPAQRMLETTKLWKLYLSLGGSLDPEPDPQRNTALKICLSAARRQLSTEPQNSAEIRILSYSVPLRILKT
jgi:hypothetical protein